MLRFGLCRRKAPFTFYEMCYIEKSLYLFDVISEVTKAIHYISYDPTVALV